MHAAGPGVVPVDPLVGESESNGHAEQAVQALKGILRTHVLALEERLGCRFPADRPVLSWMVEASADLITKHNRGPDGRTPYERLTGKPVREEGLELGESVLFRMPRSPGTNVLLEARWLEGVYVGRKRGSNLALASRGRAFDSQAWLRVSWCLLFQLGSSQPRGC